MSQHIDITITPDGVKLEPKGYTGKACLTATADLEKDLGRVTSKRKTSDYERGQRTAERQKARS